MEQRGGVEQLTECAAERGAGDEARQEGAGGHAQAETCRDEGAQPEAGVEQQLGDRLRRGRRAGSVRVVGVEVRAIVRVALGVERGPG